MSKNTPHIDKCIDRHPLRNTCSDCGYKYLSSESSSIVIRGPGEAYCGCPECGHRSLGIIPEEVAHPPDADQDNNEKEDIIYVRMSPSELCKRLDRAR